MSTGSKRLRHARQRGLDDYYGQIVRDYALCGERVGAWDSLPHADFQTLCELATAGQLDPAVIPLCRDCMAAMDRGM